MPNLIITRDEASELRQAAVDALAGAIGRSDKELEATMASLRDRLAAAESQTDTLCEGAIDDPERIAREMHNAAAVAALPAQGALESLKEKLRARAAFLKALIKLKEAAADLELAFSELAPNETVGGHPEYVESLDSFAEDMAEWLREQTEEWMLNPLGEEE